MEDEQSMRSYLSEGDLISAEVHSVFADGSLSLHMRSLKYGKVRKRIYVKYVYSETATVFSSLSERIV